MDSILAKDNSAAQSLPLMLRRWHRLHVL